MISYIYLAIAHIIASYTDIKRMEIPLWVFPSSLVVFIIEHHHEIDIFNVYGMLIIGIPMFLVSLFGKMGGGDVIMFSVVGFIIGFFYILPYTFILAVVGTCYFALLKFQKNECPIAPIAMVAYFIFMIWRYIYG